MGVTITESKDLTEIDAHYYTDFTASADKDLAYLLKWLKTYIGASEEIIPDVSLSIMLDQEVLIKNLTLEKKDIHACTQDILKKHCDIVALLAIKSLKRMKRKFDSETDMTSIEMMEQRTKNMIYLSELIKNEHGIEIPMAQQVMEP